MWPFKKNKPRRLTLTAQQRLVLRQPLNEPSGRRIIKTARTVETINEAAKNGFWPLVKRVVPSKKIHSRIAIFQDAETGEMEISGDCRSEHRGYFGNKKKVIDFFYYYQYQFPEPFAAYIIPSDLEIGECVWIEDVIEDIVSIFGNQGHHYRLNASPAVWNGEDFEILFDERDADIWIG